MNLKENKTAKSYFTWSLSSFLGFWVVLEPFREGFFYQEGEEEGDPKNSQNGSKTIQKPKKDDNEQPKYDLAVLFSLKFIFNPEGWVTCDYNQKFRISITKHFLAFAWNYHGKFSF